jgi:hypothetical protein
VCYRALNATTERLLQARQRALSKQLAHLLLEHFFNLADFLLNGSGDSLVLTLGCQVGVARDLPGILFDFAFQLSRLPWI